MPTTTAATASPQAGLLVPIVAALDALYDNNPGALSAPLSWRRYDAATIERLRIRLIEIGVRVQGEVDRRDPEWIVLANYKLAYRTFSGGPALKRAGVPVIVGLAEIVATSISGGRKSSEIRDQTAPRQRPHAAEPRYSIVVRNLMVERAALMAAMAPVTGTVATTEAADTAAVAATIAFAPKNAGGRPTSKQLIHAEAARQAQETPDAIPQTKKAWCEGLSKWLATTHPREPQLAGRTLEKNPVIADLHRGAMAAQNIAVSEAGEDL
jgi:hypothetical protein